MSKSTQGLSFPSLPTTRWITMTTIDIESTKQYLIAMGVYYPRNHPIFTCSGGSPMGYIFERDRGFSYRCSGTNMQGQQCCRRERKTERIDSFFAKRHLPVNLVLEGMFYWLNKIPRMTISTMLGCSPESTRNLISGIHQLIQMDLMNEDIQIGGLDSNGNPIIVEIDESKFGKRKYHRGHRVEGVWVLVGIEKTADRKTFLVTVPQRDAETLLQIIKKYVRPESIIYTDCWAAYGGLESVINSNYTHKTVNHSVEYVTSDGVHTNTIEGLWNGIKMNCSPRLKTKKMMPWLLMEFIWRRKYEGKLWEGLLKTLREVSFGNVDSAAIFTDFEFIYDNNEESSED